MYIMTTMKVNIREAREKFSEIVNRASYKGERVILMSRNKPRAVILGLDEAGVLKDEGMRRARRLLQLEQIKGMRERLAKKKARTDSLTELRRIRETRLGEFTGSH